MLIAFVDWPQAFVYGLITGGIAIVLTCLVYFIKAMNAQGEEIKLFENNQSTYLGLMFLGICFIVAGLYYRSSIVGLPSDSSNLSAYKEFVSKEGRFKASFPRTPKEQTQSAFA